MTSDKHSAEKLTSPEGDAPAINTSNHPDNSAKTRIDALDIGLKERQIVKTELEIAQLTKTWPRLLDIVSKAGVPVLIFITGVATYKGLPQARIDLESAKSETRQLQANSNVEFKNHNVEINKLRNEQIALTKSNDETRKETELAQSQIVTLNEQKAKIEKELAEANAGTKALRNALKVLPQYIDQVFVQFEGDITRETINGLRAAMLTAGFKAPPTERIDHKEKNMVKYFSSSPEEKARATKVAAATKEFFEKQRCPLGDVKVEKIELPGGKNAPIELWLDHAC